MKRLNKFLLMLLSAGLLVSCGGYDREDGYTETVVDTEETTVYDTDKGMFSDWDTDMNEGLNEQEFSGVMDREGIFSDWDVNRDSYLDNNEFIASTYGFWDNDGDGMIDQSEYDRMSAGWVDANGNMFTQWDTDNSGDLTEAEFRAGINNSQMYAQWDVNGDNRIDNDEFLKYSYRIWDTDRNGVVDANEYNMRSEHWVVQ